MDNLTHTLTGIALSQAGLNRKTRFATLALILASNAPDVDIVTRFRGTIAYLEYHRGYTHSILGVTALAGLLAGAIYLLGRRARPDEHKPPLSAGWLFLACWIGTGTHLLMDFTNSYGVRPFLPFSARWYAWSIMPIIDPLLLLVLVAALGLPVVFRLVSEEVGARKPDYRRGAAVALIGMAVIWGIRDLGHRRVLSLLDSHTYGDETPLREGAFPQLGPFSWVGVIETDSAFHVLAASSFASDVDAEHTEVFLKPEPSPALDAALASHAGRVFSDFARYLWAEVEPDDDGFTVTLRDLRFTAPRVRFASFVMRIELDHQLRVRSAEFHFMGPQD
jgi:inner membrane protein